MTEARLREVLEPEELAQFVQSVQLGIYPHDAKSVRMMAFLQAASNALGAILAQVGTDLAFLLGFVAVLGFSVVCGVAAARGVHRRRLIGIGAVNAVAFLAFVFAPAVAAEMVGLGPLWTLAGALGMAIGSLVVGLTAPWLLPDPEDGEDPGRPTSRGRR